MLTHHPTKSFEVDDAVVQDFRKFLDSEKVPYSEADLLENNDLGAFQPEERDFR